MVDIFSVVVTFSGDTNVAGVISQICKIYKSELQI